MQTEKREPGTIEKYLREVRAFPVWAGERKVSKDLTTAWKEHLKSQKFQPETVNANLSALNKFLRLKFISRLILHNA
ncbi:MAG: site-specific integrase [Lawsonibacter sp.]|nr:site-specific integrase [Lawsonibacter sp.]